MVGFVFATRNPIHFYWWLCELCLENVRANFHHRFDDVKAKNWGHSLLLNLHKNFFERQRWVCLSPPQCVHHLVDDEAEFAFSSCCVYVRVYSITVSVTRALKTKKKDVHIHFVIIVDGWNQFHCIWLLYGVFVVIHVAFFLLHRENIVWENICWYR